MSIEQNAGSAPLTTGTEPAPVRRRDEEIPVVEAGAATVVPDVKAEIAALEARFTALGTKISAVKAAIEK